MRQFKLMLYIQGIPKNYAPFRIALVYCSLFVNLNDIVYTFTSKDLSTAQYVIKVVKIKQLLS